MITLQLTDEQATQLLEMVDSMLHQDQKIDANPDQMLLDLQKILRDNPYYWEDHDGAFFDSEP